MSRKGNQMYDGVDSVELVESTLENLEKDGVLPLDVLIGVHNYFCHGAPFDRAKQKFSDKSLGELFDYFDGMLKLVRSKKFK